MDGSVCSSLFDLFVFSFGWLSVCLFLCVSLILSLLSLRLAGPLHLSVRLLFHPLSLLDSSAYSEFA